MSRIRFLRQVLLLVFCGALDVSFLEGSSWLAVGGGAEYRSRTESCDAILEGSRRYKLPVVPPETVPEVHDGMQDEEIEAEKIVHEETQQQQCFASNIRSPDLYEKLLALEAQQRAFSLHSKNSAVGTISSL